MQLVNTFYCVPKVAGPFRESQKKKWGGGGGGGGGVGGGKGGEGVFAGGWEVKVFSEVFQDFGKNMVEKQYFEQ